MRAILIFMLVASAAAADDARLSGQVLDSTDAVLPGVTVEAGGATTVTGNDGTYTLAVPAGTYDVSFQLLNFATTVRRGVVVPSRIDVTLYLSASADVVVTARRTFRNLADLDEPVNDLLGIADAATQGVITTTEIERRPFQRAGEIMETVPGVVVSQHSGEGKANQYYLRGFNLDHGTDIAITVAGVPVNMPTHGHGQGYADANFLIPELISGVQYKKGSYYADEGDFASAGAVNVNYLSLLDKPIALVQGGSAGFQRALFAASPRVGEGYLLLAIETGRNDGPWVRPDDFRKLNGVLRYTQGDQRGGFSITAMGYDADWSSTDQIPVRAVTTGAIPRFGLVDPTDGGTTSRYSLAAAWQRNSSNALTQTNAYAIRYRLNLFSNFTYFLDHPEDGDQFEQADDRFVAGVRASHRWLARWGGVSVENVAGVQARHDAIGNVGLYHTRERVRLATTRQDHVDETSGAVFAQSALQWTPWLRTIAGLRADQYRFDVGAQRETASIVSPKLSMIFGPWRKTELYANAGNGFHSNDARGITQGVTPLTRTRGAEVGIRTTPVPRFHMTASLWALDMASELLFVGDAGTTEASRPSRRAGVELSTFYNLFDWLAVDADYAYSRARFRDEDPSGDRIPGAVEGVASVGLSVIDWRGISGELRYRYFGPRPLIEDDSVRSQSSNLVNARIGYRLTPQLRLDVDVFNILDAKVSDIDYFYTSRLPNEPDGGVDGIHFHPVEKRAFRVGISRTF
ncbi:MAG TPA: TonB-dependent receptor [Thermoanaerobaculia bacterium]|jgi:outer membrane receptor protein involved in Fe transport|nr:TonB-dependent receptor [Thermoanaerobaculia bacterium]